MFGLPLEAVLGIISSLGGFLMKASAQKAADQQKLLEYSLRKQEANNASADAAAKRSDPFLRKLAAMVVLFVAFLGLFLIAFFPEIPVTIVERVAPKSFLGFEYGGGLKTTVANGFVIPEWFKYSVISIVHFLFGTGAAKVAR
tara:strand:- start:5735 stop:6163 length:429 start_codon:yes stop_codon:yes gene_type:complete